MNVHRQIEALWERYWKMALDFTRLENDVANISSVVDSAVKVLTDLAQEIRDSAGNVTKAEALAQKLEDETAALSTAIAANTPAAPTA